MRNARGGHTYGGGIGLDAHTHSVDESRRLVAGPDPDKPPEESMATAAAKVAVIPGKAFATEAPALRSCNERRSAASITFA